MSKYLLAATFFLFAHSASASCQSRILEYFNVPENADFTIKSGLENSDYTDYFVNISGPTMTVLATVRCYKDATRELERVL